MELFNLKNKMEIVFDFIEFLITLNSIGQ